MDGFIHSLYRPLPGSVVDAYVLSTLMESMLRMWNRKFAFWSKSGRTSPTSITYSFPVGGGLLRLHLARPELAFGHRGLGALVIYASGYTREKRQCKVADTTFHSKPRASEL